MTESDIAVTKTGVFLKSIAEDLNETIISVMEPKTIEPFDVGVIDDESTYINTKTRFAYCRLSVAFKDPDGSEYLPRRTQVELVLLKPDANWNHRVFQEMKRLRSELEAPFYGNVFWQQLQADGSSEPLKRRVIGVFHPLTPYHELQQSESEALRWWIKSTVSSLSLAIEHYLPQAMERAKSSPGL